MSRFELPYGRGKISCEIPDERLNGVIVSRLHSYRPEKSEQALISEAMERPVGSARLRDLAKGKENVVVIASDHTRPVPSKLIIPPMLAEIRAGNPNAKITLLIATGCHRGTAQDELVDKFGAEIVSTESIVVHDCDDADRLISLGTLPSGGELKLNRLAAQADLLVAEGFIEPHFFAGFSGGRKSVLPGGAGRESVLANHCSEFISHPAARTGALDGNPIHRDMLWAARTAGLAYVVNVALDADKRVVYAVAGDMEAAHAAGCDFLRRLCLVKPVPSDIVISTNGGYPLDQNVYQAVKGMTAAEATVREGGVIIMAAQSGDGHGGERFYRQLADEPDGEKTLSLFLSRGRNETEPDQWQTQILLRILKKATVLYLSDAPEETVRALHMTPIRSVEEGVRLADRILGRSDAKITVIPDGVSVIVGE